MLAWAVVSWTARQNYPESFVRAFAPVYTQFQSTALVYSQFQSSALVYSQFQSKVQALTRGGPSETLRCLA